MNRLSLRKFLGIILLVVGIGSMLIVPIANPFPTIVFSVLLGILVGIPARVKIRNVRKALESEEYAKALRYYPKSLFNPKNSARRAMRELLSALLLAKEGKLGDAEPRIRHLFEHPNPEIVSWALLRYGLYYGFERLLPWFDSISPSEEACSPDLIPVYARTLAETGQIQELLSLHLQWKNSPRKVLANSAIKQSCLLFIFAFAGKVPQTRVLAKLLLPDNPCALTYWLAIAELASGGHSEARRLLSGIQTEAPIYLQRSIHHHLEDCLSGKPPIAFEPFELKQIEDLCNLIPLNPLNGRQRRRKRFKLLGYCYG